MRRKPSATAKSQDQCTTSGPLRSLVVRHEIRLEQVSVDRPAAAAPAAGDQQPSDCDHRCRGRSRTGRAIAPRIRHRYEWLEGGSLRRWPAVSGIRSRPSSARQSSHTAAGCVAPRHHNCVRFARIMTSSIAVYHLYLRPLGQVHFGPTC
jgi:hypothetical protein